MNTERRGRWTDRSRRGRHRWINERLPRDEGGRKMDRDYGDSRTERRDRGEKCGSGGDYKRQTQNKEEVDSQKKKERKKERRQKCEAYMFAQPSCDFQNTFHVF